MIQAALAMNASTPAYKIGSTESIECASNSQHDRKFDVFLLLGMGCYKNETYFRNNAKQ